MKDTLDYSLNVTEFPAPHIKNIWNPKSISELCEILVTATKTKTPVYPISTGHNWGLGSKLPVVDADIISLSGINDILEVNESLAYARIQPGVTQIQLANFLKENHPSLILNVTGSDAHSSILANAIERGSGKNGHRANDIRELKIMGATGDEFMTGFGAFANKQKPSFYKYGLGPDLTHLFTQSNMGIVTEGVINLMPRQDFELFLTRIPEAKLGIFLEVFAGLVRKGIIGHSLEIDSQNDPKIFELFETESVDSKSWICWFALYGEDELRIVKDNIIRRELAGLLSEIKSYPSTEDHTSTPAPVQVRISRYNGIPNDHSLLSTAKSFGVELSEDNPDLDLYKKLPGFRCVLPVIPFSADGAKTIELILNYSKGTPFEPAISIIGLDEYALEVFARVYFNREDSREIEKAAMWASGLLHQLKEQNIFPYRLDVENMIPYLSNVNDPLSEVKNIIKKHLDPAGILAPGRYQLISNT
ncbi:FAD-binding oxidoreductase [Ekhidna sp. To15]|uniref:FAD-dependent oxidoreductase n=1 Tax=Ekhidna sp. To15 TaxID=3395267 RepID=UPI003F521DF9